jgi:AraC family transcriptional regulator
MVRGGMRRTTVDDYERRMLRVQHALSERLDEEIAPAEFARIASFSLHHFHRIFRARVGESVMQHVRRLRLERAARRLRGTDDRILDLALEAGFSSHEAFTRAFADQFGVPPSDFRAQPNARVAAHLASTWGAPIAAVTVREEPSLRVAFMRHRGGYAGIEAFWAAMYGWVHARGLRGGLFGVCPDDPEVTIEEHLRFDACVVVDDGFTLGPDDGANGLAEIPAGTYAVGLHVGPFERLSETYLDVIGRWFPASGYELAPDAPVIEHYLDDPSVTPAAQLRTEVRVRIET